MTLKLSRIGSPQIMFEGEGAGGGGGDGGAAAAAAAAAAPESVLFPNEGKTAEQIAADAAAGKTGEPGSGGATDWKEFVADPAKTPEENAAAKVEHDKTKPAEKSDAEKALDLVPDDGKYNLTMPDGVEVDQELLDALGPALKSKGYTHREAQALADEFIKVQTAREGKKLETWGERIQGWADTAKKDPEIGGDKWDATVSAATRATTALGTPELKQYLNASGGGNHPELIRFMAKVGAMIKEDTPAKGGAEGQGKPADPAHVLFPNDAPKG